MQKRTINTRLHGKDDVFRAMALAETCGMPILLHGLPGVAKTQSMLDYAASVEGDLESAFKKSFIIELDEGTRPSEIRGMIDMKKLHLDKEYDVITPIADAQYVMINEVDKGTSGVRNTMLCAMRERALLIGHEIRPCKWSLFVGTCNKINDDPDEAPYWDRWLLKIDVPRVSKDKLVAAWTGPQKFDIMVGTPQEVEAFVPTDQKEFERCIGAFMELYYDKMTDRTVFQIPFIIKACHMVYGIDMVDSTIQAANLMSRDKNMIKTLTSKIEDKVITDLKTKIGQLPGMYESNAVRPIVSDVLKFMKNPDYGRDKKSMIKQMLVNAVEQNEVLRNQEQFAEILGKKNPKEQVTANE